MDEYVSLQAVLDIVSQYCPDDDGSCSKADVDLREMLDEIEALPTTDVNHGKCGEWEIIYQNGKPKLKCTNCYSLFNIRTNDKHICIYPKFCEECGADMRCNIMRNLTDKETSIYESWIESEAEDTGENIMDGDVE